MADPIAADQRRLTEVPGELVPLEDVAAGEPGELVTGMVAADVKNVMFRCQTVTGSACEHYG